MALLRIRVVTMTVCYDDGGKEAATDDYDEDNDADCNEEPAGYDVISFKDGKAVGVFTKY